MKNIVWAVAVSQYSIGVKAFSQLQWSTRELVCLITLNQLLHLLTV